MPESHRQPSPSELCPSCGASLKRLVALDYRCDRCGRFLDNLYRAQHVDRAAARCLTIDQIAAEYRAVGEPLPGWTP